MCLNPIEAMSSSVVSDTLTFLWMCKTLVFGIEICIAASSREPAAMEEIRSDATWTFSSRRPASSAYSRELIETWLGGMPTVTPALGLSCILKMYMRPVMKAIGENISPWSTPRAMIKAADVSSFPSGFLILTQPEAASKMDWMTRRSFADAPAELSALSRNVWLTVSNAAV